jgi:hypothetical protein
MEWCDIRSMALGALAYKRGRSASPAVCFGMPQQGETVLDIPYVIRYTGHPSRPCREDPECAEGDSLP